MNLGIFLDDSGVETWKQHMNNEPRILVTPQFNITLQVPSKDKVNYHLSQTPSIYTPHKSQQLKQTPKHHYSTSLLLHTYIHSETVKN